MNSKLTCVDCGNVFFGGIHSSFGNGLGMCSICQSSRKANERFEKEMAERRKYERQSSYTNSNSSYSSTHTVEASESPIWGILMLVVLAIVIFVSIVIFSSLENSPRKEYSFYTPNDGSLKQSLKPGVTYHQYQCQHYDAGQCVAIPNNDFDRFCNEFDGINTVGNREILDGNTGEITSLSREVIHSSFDNSRSCIIKFSMVFDGEVKTGVARVITWIVNADGKLIPDGSYRSTRWQ